jgi:hypothetical protein
MDDPVKAEAGDQPDDVITPERHARTLALALGGLANIASVDLYLDAKSFRGSNDAAAELADMLDRLALLERADAAIDKLWAEVAKSMNASNRAEAERSCCVDCGDNTLKIREHFMVHDEVWAKAGMNPNGGMLCIGCLERRIGRKLCRDDFIDAPINKYARSKRWEDRLAAPKAAKC